jgi:CheY-like chemotaxis protein
MNMINAAVFCFIILIAHGLHQTKPFAFNYDTSRGERMVLVADDSPSTRRFLKTHFEHSGYAVDMAENGQGALNLMKRAAYDIVFLDLEMPVMDGFACSSAFREWESTAQDRTRRQPICILSMHTGEKEKERCAEVGADFFESKPINIPGLMKIAELCIKLQNK